MPVGCFRHQSRKGSKSVTAAELKRQAPRDASLKLGVPDNSSGTDVVTICRKCDDDILGIIFSGGLDKANKPHITNLRPGGLAARCDGLMIGDYITGINGIQTERLKHDEIVILIKNTASLIQIEIAYSLPPRAPQSAFSVKCRKTTVSLTKDEQSIGLVIRGGAHELKSKSRPLTVTYVRQNGAAHRDGSIRVGDRIVAINGVTVITALLEQAQRLIRECHSVAHLVIEYDIAVMETVQNADGPLLVEIGRSVGSDLGLTLQQRPVHGKPCVVIGNIATASIAERCGALHIGDHVLTIDGVELTNMSEAEAKHFLTSGTTKLLQLEILPVGHLYSNNPTLVHPDRGIKRGSNAVSGGFSSECPLDTSFYSVFSEEHNPLPPTRRPSSHSNAFNNRLITPHTAPLTRRLTSIRSISSIASTVGHSTMCHEETMKVCLYPNNAGLGIMLHSNTLPSEPMDTHPFIGTLEPNGSAERCGVIQEGDRVLSINGIGVIGCSLAECKQLLNHTGAKCLLDVAFDVADADKTSSGTFQVKLYKQGGSTGMTLDDKLSSSGVSEVIVSHIKRGSAAHRSGTVHCGDQVISIENINLTNVQVEDARQILDNADDVVKIKLRKDRARKDSCTGGLMFSVEIPKENNSLGLTISGKAQPNQPIIISEITSGGIAERIGALRVGDKLISINGKSLQGKPVTFAIQLLQRCGEVVLLTVCRDRDKQSLLVPGLYSKTADQHSGQSRDSAVDSWESQISPASNRGKLLQQDQEYERRDGRADWSKMISELENFGNMEISGILTDLSVPINSQRPSASSPHDENITIPPPNIPEMSSSNSAILSLVIYKEEHETFGFGLSNALSAEGCYICAVGRESPAERAGLRKYDRVIQVNDTNVQSHSCNEIVPLFEMTRSILEMVIIRSAHEPELTHTGSIRSSHHSSLDSLGYC